MAASFGESQKLDYLWKKVGYGVAKTSIPPPGSGSKEAFNESIASPLLYRGDLVWKDSGDIPSTPPSDTTSIVQVYQDGGGGGYSATVQCTEDLTSPDNQTWKTNLANWIPTQFGDNYLVKVYVDTTGSTTPQTTGTRLFQAGSGSDDTWFFDYQAGILNFNGAAIPSVITGGVSGKSVFVVGYRYVGVFGVGGDLGNITFSNNTISSSSANATIVIQPTGTGLVIIDTTTGLTVPSGNTAQRPGSAGSGTLRFNTLIQNLEVYNGTSWVEAGGSGNTFTITNQTISPDGSSAVYTLDQDSTSSSILLTINGVNQTPDIDYSVAGNSLTMATTPLNSDLVQVRFLAGLITNNTMTNSSGNAVITVAASGNIDLQPSTDHSVNSYGNILPAANVTYNLGSTTRRWKDLWLAGSTLTLGNIVIKNSSGNTISFYGPDGVTPATLDANAEIVADSISSGTSNVSIPTANGNVRTVANGNVTLIVTSTGANVTGTLNATGNANVGNLSATNIVGTLTTATQTNITSVGTLGSLSVTGNVTGGNISATAHTGTTVSVTGNVTGGNLSGTNIVGTLTTAAQTNITSVGTLGSLSVTGNVTGGNLSGTDIVGTLTTATQTNITSVGTLGSLSVTGNVTGGNLSGTSIVGTLTTAAQTNITSVGTLTSLAVTGNITSGNLSGTSIVGTLTTAAQTNITSVGTLGALSVTGNVTGGNLSGTSIVGTLTTATQTNITSVGTLGALSVTGNVTGGNVITTGSAGMLLVNSIEHSGSNSVGNIGSASSYFNTVFATSTSAQYADLAEKYSSDDWYSPGTVLVFGGSAHVTACIQYADHRAAGVVSTAPAHLMNAELSGTTATVALAGQVTCKVIGPVSKGDVLTTSAVEGYAEVLDFSQFNPGCIIGKALEECDSGPTTILIAVVR